MFTDVDIKLKESKKDFSWHPGATATLFVVLTIMANLLDRMSSMDFNNSALEVVGILLIPVVAAVLFKAQQAINVACDDPSGSINSKLTLANWAWIIAFGLTWLLFLLAGLNLPVESPEP